MYFLTTKVLRCLFWGVLAVCAMVLAACLGLRYLVLPKVGQWRPQIEQYASQALGSPVRIGAISADWSGLNPRLHLSAVQFYDGPDTSQPTVTLPVVDAVIAWRSVLRMTPRLLLLRIDGADLSARRDASGRVWVAGMSFDPNAPSSSGKNGDGKDGGQGDDPPALVWLSEQRELALTGMTLHWMDERRQAPELVFSHVDAFLKNGVLSHRFSLHMTPPRALSAGVTVRGEIKRRFFGLRDTGPASWNGDFYVQLDDAEPAEWSPWVTLPDVRGRFAARAWVRLTRGQIGDATLDAVIRGLDAVLPGQGRLAAQQVHLHLDGTLGDLDLPSAGVLPLPLAHSRSGSGVALQVQVQGLETSLPQLFDTPSLQADSLHVDASLVRPPGHPLALELRQLQLKNDDMDLALQGRWNDGGQGGTADFRGKLARASLAAISRYLPKVIPPGVRQWFAEGLPEGEARDATVTLKGPLADFPYTHPGDTGQFRVAGRYEGARVDYAPAGPDHKGWPVLSGLSGTFAVDRASLTLDSAGGTMETGPGQQVALHGMHAVIPDMEHDVQLDVAGTSTGAVPAYLAMLAHTPLGALFDGVLDHAEGSGDWQVSLKLRVPFEHVSDTKVDGRIQFQGNNFQLMPRLPGMSGLQGDLAFSEQGLQPDLRGNFLGGPMQLSGRLGYGDALAFSGTLAASALDELGKLPAFERFAGKTAYQGKLSYAKNGEVDVSVRSELAGMAIDLPAPLGKTASATMPLNLQWSSAAGRRGRHRLSGDIGQNINLLLEHDPSDHGAYFTRGAVGIGRTASLPASGLTLSGTLDTLDIDAWNDALKSFGPAPAKGRAPARPEQPVLPELEQASLSVRHLVAAGQNFDDLTLDARQPVPGQWRVSVASSQVSGTLEWAQASGAAAGKITARFDRLALGKADADADDKGDKSGKTKKSDKPDKSDDGKGNDLSDIPGIDLQARQFVLYGHDVGSLNVVGTNLERGNLWRLDKLNIFNSSATLDATGSWRLRGPDRGLSADARLEFKDVGAMLDRLDWHPVSGGHGTIQGKFFWRNFPWRYDKADIEGSMHVDLEKGRFMNLGSYSARLLELLSLQSLSRLATLNTNPVNLLREGFSFDTVTGNLRLSKGVMYLNDYKVNGPAAAIALEGNADVVNELWDLHAVVVPNLDASGAAIATALVNPVIGLGAFITQWLLKQPLARAMASEYRVTGTWDDPKIQTVERPATSAGTAPTH